MRERLDELIEQLAALPTDRGLEHLEAEVVQAVVRGRGESRANAALAPVRLAAVGVALAIGFTAGGAIATASGRRDQSVEAFSPGVHLAPSSLLERAR